MVLAMENVSDDDIFPGDEEEEDGELTPSPKKKKAPEEVVDLSDIRLFLPFIIFFESALLILIDCVIK